MPICLGAHALSADGLPMAPQNKRDRMGGLDFGEVSGMPESRRASLAPVAVLGRALDLGGNQGKSSRERGVYTQIGGVEQVGVGRLDER